MYICLCKNITDKTLKSLKLKGKKSLKEIQNACSAGTMCGICIPDIKAFLSKNHSKEQSLPTPPEG